MLDTVQLRGELLVVHRLPSTSADRLARPRAAMATFPTSPKAKNTYVHIEPNKQVASLSQVLLEREFLPFASSFLAIGNLIRFS